MDYSFVRLKIRNAKNEIDNAIRMAGTDGEFLKLRNSLQRNFFEHLKDAQRELDTAKNHLPG